MTEDLAELVETWVRRHFATPDIDSDEYIIDAADLEIGDIVVTLAATDVDGKWFDVQVSCSGNISLDDGEPYDLPLRQDVSCTLRGKVLVSDPEGEPLLQWEPAPPERINYETLTREPAYRVPDDEDDRQA